MFLELNNILNITPEYLPKGKSFLVTESQSDSTFVLHHFLSLYIRSGCSVCLVGLLQPFNHYRNVATKLRVDLNKARETGQFVFIEGLKTIGEHFTADSRQKSDNQLATTDIDCLSLLYGVEKLQCTLNLKPLHDVIKSTVHSFRVRDPSKPVLVIFDDISVLWSLGSSRKDVLSCVQYVRRMVCWEGEGCLLTGLHIPDPEDDDAELIGKYLTHQSDCVIAVRGLKSGHSKDVHGEMSIRWKDIGQSKPTPDRLSLMQFKITDKNVNFFALGTSAAVL